MLFNNRELEYKCRLSDSFDPIENTNTDESEDSILPDRNKNIQSWVDSENSSYSNVYYLVRDIRNFISDDTFLVRDSNRDSYYIYFDSENQIFEIERAHSFLFLNELKKKILIVIRILVI